MGQIRFNSVSPTWGKLNWMVDLKKNFFYCYCMAKNGNAALVYPHYLISHFLFYSLSATHTNILLLHWNIHKCHMHTVHAHIQYIHIQIWIQLMVLNNWEFARKETVHSGVRLRDFLLVRINMWIIVWMFGEHHTLADVCDSWFHDCPFCLFSAHTLSRVQCTANKLNELKHI